MERDLKHQLLHYIEKIDKLGKQLSALRQHLTELLYRLPKEKIEEMSVSSQKQKTRIAHVLSLVVSTKLLLK